MTTMIHFVITGHPVAKGRARSVLIPKKGGGYVTTASGQPVIHHHTPAKTRTWEADARQVARDAMKGAAPLTGPLELTINITMAIPESWPAWKRQAALEGWIEPDGKPDLDNVVKAAKDASNGILWLDDSQVVSTASAKTYGDRPGVYVKVLTRATVGHHATRAEMLAAMGIQGRIAA